jgi:hypothetical protein
MTSPTGPEFGLALPLDPTSLVCISLGVVIVALHSMRKFEESTVEKSEDDFIAQLLPKYLATREEYSRALVWYMGSMIGILCALSAIGPRLLEILAPTLSAYAPVAPLGFALILVGVLPNVPWLQDIEWRVRRFWHERAFIPTAARSTADMLRASNFDFSSYKQKAVLTSPGMRELRLSDFEAPRGSLEHGWARLSCLSHDLGWRRDAGETELLDDEMLDRYSNDLDNIASKRQALESDVAQYRKERVDNPFYVNDRLHNSIKSALRHLYVLLGCAVRLRVSRSADINAAFRSFGFVLAPSTPIPGNQDLIIVGLTVMTGSLLMLVFTAMAAGSLFEMAGLWHRSAYFPNDVFQPFLWSLSAALAHGVAILTADWMRARHLYKGHWFAVVGRERRAITANYVRVALGCAITGYVAMFLWGLIFQAPTVAFAEGTLPYSLLPAATGGFYTFHLDNVELGQRPSRLWEIGSQTLVTALCGLVAAPVWLTLGGGNATDDCDFIILVTLLGSVVGASLAWYLPRAAANRRSEIKTQGTQVVAFPTAFEQSSAEEVEEPSVARGVENCGVAA